MTLLNIGFIIAGIILVIFGADRMTDGASKLARDMRVLQHPAHCGLFGCSSTNRCGTQHG